MPLLNIVGLTGTLKTFIIYLIFMKSETKEDYHWALSKLKEAYNGVIPGVIVTDRDLA
jgi:hypothetical protein